MCHSTASSDQGSLAVDGSSTGNGAQKVDFSVAVYSGAEHVINSMQVPLEGAFTRVNFVEVSRTGYGVDVQGGVIRYS